MLYQLYELTHATVSPWRTWSKLIRQTLDHPANPWGYTYAGKAGAAALEVFEDVTRRYGKPEWRIEHADVDSRPVEVRNHVVARHNFCELRRFRLGRADASKARKKLLLVAPLSGHFATLLRGTVRTLVKDFDVYVTDWTDAREVPVTLGAFSLDEYVRAVMRFMKIVGPRPHVVAVCQPGPAVLAATALLAEDGDAARPASVVLMGSPIDTRKSPTEPNRLAKTRPLSWFRDNVITNVPFPHLGAARRVYPGFLQLTGFMSMNLDRHVHAHQNLFQHLVVGDGDSVAAHRRFYDEYLSVMDLPAEYYLDTIRIVFQEHQLPEGLMRVGKRAVDLSCIRDTALMTVEGENDDISGIGQTQAAHDLCVNVPTAQRLDYVQPGVGHYGVFNGSKWRQEIAPRIVEFVTRQTVAG